MCWAVLAGQYTQNPLVLHILSAATSVTDALTSSLNAIVFDSYERSKEGSW